ncbi:site-specific recombinase, DNA invertase Pin [Aciduliprofundum sp. MAR08-339]|uniref:recombinase family protein n=1 Tax=Aciduliprofundum sp. (strain MAR08-339) TaxID=673860 RepID=UPI0002A499FB|nr:site-specific recombinase, DNA invertase Pin [Aciduliprofundum sp. MAR08-339]AGB04111.1 site-specific recombinase, DNA invertase Pin [Aciduliprofundum sp. MAR08-339]
MKAIIYARVSTEEQKRKGYSIEAQIEACRAYAKAKGWDVVLEFKEAKSGKSAENREQLQRALTFLEEGGADILLVWRLDRLTRSIIDFQKILERVGPKISSVVEGLDMSTSAGRFVANILIAFAQYERESIGERTKLGLERAKKEGKHIGRRAKYPDEIAEKVRRLAQRGFSRREISEKLGIPDSAIRSILYYRKS